MDGLDEGLRFYSGYNFVNTIENMIYSLRINLVTVPNGNSFLDL